MTQANNTGSVESLPKTPAQKIAGARVLSEAACARLTQKQLLDYQPHREAFMTWLLTHGKNPKEFEGYAEATVRRTAYDADRFYQWVWDREGSYTLGATTDHADEYIVSLLEDPGHSRTNCSKVRKSLLRLFRWKATQLGGSEWEPEVSIAEGNDTSAPREYFTKKERLKLREAALEYADVSAVSNWADGEETGSWKIPSLVWTALDAGLRPVEIERASVKWLDTQNELLRIPKADSAKNEGNWNVAISARTATALERWMRERADYRAYDETDSLWLNRQGNPYNSRSLNYLLGKLLELTDIDPTTRSLSWYAIRHSTGTYMASERDLAAAQAQLRHYSEVTTMRYDHTPVDERRGALDQMG